MRVAIALYQPDIALNTGTILRLGACLGLPIHIIHPTGFAFSRAALKRSGMDYLDQVEMTEHTGYAAFKSWIENANRRLVLLTTKTETAVYQARFMPSDVLLLGRESAGVPERVAADAGLKVRIPMQSGARSLNVAVTAALVAGEALRQTSGFDDLV